MDEAVHEIFERLKDENNRQNHRIQELEDAQKGITELTLSVQKLAQAVEVMAKEQEEGGITYEYETVVFSLPDDRDETVKSITTNFADWWEYGKTPEETPTLAERVAILEELMLG